MNSRGRANPEKKASFSGLGGKRRRGGTINESRGGGSEDER